MIDEFAIADEERSLICLMLGICERPCPRLDRSLLAIVYPGSRFCDICF